MSKFGVWLLATLIAFGVACIAVSAACLYSDQPVTPADIVWAEQVCASNNGLEVLWVDIGDLQANCANGAKFTIAKKDVAK